MVRWALVVTLVVIVALGGCNQLFGLKDVVITDAGANVVQCGPLAFDPARYRAKTDEKGVGFSWQAARDACRFDGYDLAVLDQDDSAELMNEATGAPLPFWMGVSYGTDWAAVDGCAPVLDWSAGEPSESKLGDCAAKNMLGLRSDLCTHVTANTVPINALCETPRPTVRCVQLQAERNYMAVPGNVTHDAAESACGALGMHLVEINSSDELAYVLGHFPGTPAFWLGAAKGGGTFTSPTGCPQAWTWGPRDPDATNSCVAYHQGAMQSFDCNNQVPLPGIICEMNSAI